MDARLGLKTCDKCNKVMKHGERIMVVTAGVIAGSNDVAFFKGEGVEYACHKKCWDNYVGLET